MKIKLLSLLLILSRLTNAQTISGGGFHSLFLCGNQTPMTSGQNVDGQFGDATNTSDSTLRWVILNDVKAVAGGWKHSLFLKNDSTVWASGDNSGGQLGDGTGISRSIPVQVSSLSGVIAIAAGYNTSLFLKSDGTVWGCGYNEDGQLGNNPPYDSIPVQIDSLSGIIAIAEGWQNSIFLKNDGTVWGCGSNYYGQLGQGTPYPSQYTPIQISSLSGITAIASGSWDNYFLKSDSTVWACGANWYGELGDGTTIERDAPVQITSLSGITAIGIGGGWFHALFLKSNGTAWTCGFNQYGELGNGNFM